jgi:hypothetical protein
MFLPYNRNRRIAGQLLALIALVIVATACIVAPEKIAAVIVTVIEGAHHG